MSPAILGIGTAVPTHAIAQQAAAEAALGLCPPGPEGARLVPVLYRRTQIDRRGSVLLENGSPDGAVGQSFFRASGGPTDRGPGTAARLLRYATEAPSLAGEAAGAALRNAETDAASITHLVTVSCTGFTAPGIDAALIERLGLARTVERTHIGFMGCHGVINGLRVARALAAAERGERGERGASAGRALVLLCAVELCSLHFHYTTDPEKMVANALFADGAGAAVVGAASDEMKGGDGPSWRIAATGSCLMPGSLDAMTWTIGDHGFEMTLSARVPSLLEEHLGPWVRAWLASLGLGLGDIGSYAVHPGGPRLLTTVAECLALSEGSLAASRAILAEHGNMSSPTVLFILERLRRERAQLPCLCLAFGPGLVVEAALIS